MSKRLQVLLDEREFRAVRRVARASHLTVAEWVRQTLRAAYRRLPEQGPERKLAALERASKHSFPTGDIDQMLSEIERGYRT
jgi:hypothetical protein